MIIYEDRPKRAPPAVERAAKSAKRALSRPTVRACAKAILDRHQRQMLAVSAVVVAVYEYGYDAACRP